MSVVAYQREKRELHEQNDDDLIGADTPLLYSFRPPTGHLMNKDNMNSSTFKGSSFEKKPSRSPMIPPLTRSICWTYTTAFLLSFLIGFVLIVFAKSVTLLNSGVVDKGRSSRLGVSQILSQVVPTSTTSGQEEFIPKILQRDSPVKQLVLHCLETYPALNITLSQSVTSFITFTCYVQQCHIRLTTPTHATLLPDFAYPYLSPSQTALLDVADSVYDSISKLTGSLNSVDGDLVPFLTKFLWISTVGCLVYGMSAFILLIVGMTCHQAWAFVVWISVQSALIFAVFITLLVDTFIRFVNVIIGATSSSRSPTNFLRSIHLIDDFNDVLLFLGCVAFAILCVTCACISMQIASETQNMRMWKKREIVGEKTYQTVEC